MSPVPGSLAGWTGAPCGKGLCSPRVTHQQSIVRPHRLPLPLLGHAVREHSRRPACARRAAAGAGPPRVRAAPRWVPSPLPPLPAPSAPGARPSAPRPLEMQRVSLVAGHASPDGGPWTLPPSSQPAPWCGRGSMHAEDSWGATGWGAVTPAGVRSRSFRSRCVLGERRGALRAKAERSPRSQSPDT